MAFPMNPWDGRIYEVGKKAYIWTEIDKAWTRLPFTADKLLEINQKSVRGPELQRKGWILVTDTARTDTSPLSVIGNTRTLLPNNAGSILNVTNPIGGDSWWTANKFTPDNSGDTYDFRVQFTCDPVLNNRNLTLEMDIGGDQGVIWDKTIRLARGAGVDTRVTETMDLFTLDTFITNGGEVYITCDGDTGVYDIIFKIERKYRAD